MIKNLTICNFQSHEESHLEFSEGVNILTGNSDCGKSSIMRALIWAITNSPSGDSFVRNDIRDDKGKIKGLCYVTVDGLKRVKSAKDNCYLLDGEKYEALRGEVPANVSKSLGIGEVSIQKQLDGPFMLSNTSGENARYINSLVNLETIDSSLSWIASKKRSTESSLDFTAKELEQVKTCNNDDLQACKEAIERLEMIDGKIADFEHRCNIKLDEYSNICRVADTDTSLLEYDVLTLEANNKTANEITTKAGTLFKLLNEYCSIRTEVTLPDTKELERVESECEQLNGKVVFLLKVITEFKGLFNNIEALDAELKNLHSQLDGQVCPCCGQIYRG